MFVMVCSPKILAETHSEEFAKRFGLGFSAADREENIRRVGAVARLFVESGTIAITAFISPYRSDRDAVRALNPNDFYEVHVATPLEVCEQRDPKGLYKKARAGEIKGFTGIDDPYEAPVKPELTLDASTLSADELADQVIAFLKGRSSSSTTTSFGRSTFLRRTAFFVWRSPVERRERG